MSALVPILMAVGSALLGSSQSAQQGNQSLTEEFRRNAQRRRMGPDVDNTLQAAFSVTPPPTMPLSVPEQPTPPQTPAGPSRAIVESSADNKPQLDVRAIARQAAPVLLRAFLNRPQGPQFEPAQFQHRGSGGWGAPPSGYVSPAVYQPMYGDPMLQAFMSRGPTF